jgi:hypothetical protein
MSRMTEFTPPTYNIRSNVEVQPIDSSRVVVKIMAEVELPQHIAHEVLRDARVADLRFDNPVLLFVKALVVNSTEALESLKGKLRLALAELEGR